MLVVQELSEVVLCGSRGSLPSRGGPAVAQATRGKADGQMVSRVAGARCCSLTFMTTDQELFALAERVGQKLRGAGRRLATAESCTGGWVAKACTDVAGSSQWFECGFITYSNAAKVRDVGVSERTLVDHGAVSEATVREMAAGALRVSGKQ